MEQQNGEQQMESTKDSEMQYLGAISKMTQWSWFFPRQTIQHHIDIYASPTNAKEVEIGE